MLELAEKLHKTIIRNFRKRKLVHSTFVDNIWSADVADMQLVSKVNKGTCFLLCVIDISGKCAWVTPLKKALQLLMLFKKSWMNLIANQTNHGKIKAVNFIIDLWNHGSK